MGVVGNNYHKVLRLFFTLLLLTWSSTKSWNLQGFMFKHVEVFGVENSRGQYEVEERHNPLMENSQVLSRKSEV